MSLILNRFINHPLSHYVPIYIGIIMDIIVLFGFPSLFLVKP